MLSIGRRTQLRTAALARVAFTLFALLLVAARDAQAVEWADARAHDKGCDGTSHIFDVRCEHPDGSWSHECPDMPRRQFRGSAMTTNPVRLPDRAWIRVAIADATCGGSVEWADARAHDKGCDGTSHIFDVRCEHPDGSWSHECPDMPKRQFRGSAMTTNPVRLPDRAWTRVAIADATCNPASVVKETTGKETTPPLRGKIYVLPDGTIERGAVNNPPDPEPTTTPLRGKVYVLPDGTIERGAVNNPPDPEPTTTPPPGGGTASAPTTQATAQPPGGGTTSNPPATASPPENPSSPPQGSAQKRPPRSETALAPAQSPPAACDAEKVTLCKTLLQDRVPWQMRSEPEYRHWQEGNLDNLCRCTPDAAQTVQCFQNELYNNRDSWQKAIDLCRAR